VGTDAVLLVLIAAAAAAVVLHALFGPREVWDRDQGIGVLAGLGRRKARLLRVLKDLDDERAIGTLDEREYQELRDAYKRRTVEVMREIDRVRAARVRHLARGCAAVAPSLRRRIENDVARRRSARIGKGT
jgi:ribosomal protein S13